MDLKQHQSLGTLWLYSFKLFAKTWWRSLVAFLIFLAVGQIVSAVLKLFISVFGIGVIFGGGDPQAISFVLVGIMLIVFTISQTYTCYFWAILIQMSYKALRQERVSLLEAAGHSFKAAWSLFLVSFLAGLIILPSALLARKSVVLGGLVTLVVSLTILIRWTYASRYIVLQQVGTLDSLSFSWDLTRNRYGDTFLMWLLIAVSWAGYMLVMLLTAFPIVKIVSRSVGMYMLGGVLGIGICQIVAFLTVVFVNRDTVANPRMTVEEMNNWTPPEIAEDFTDLQPILKEPAVAKSEAKNIPTMDKIE